MAPVLSAAPVNHQRKTVSFHLEEKSTTHVVPNVNESPLDHQDALEEAEEEHASGVLRDAKLGGLPAKQGLYDPDLEKDSCG
jgi:glutamate synthase (NADPH/NADH)